MHFSFLVNCTDQLTLKDHLAKEYLRTIGNLKRNSEFNAWSLLLGDQPSTDFFAPEKKVSTYNVGGWCHRFRREVLWKPVPGGRNWK